MNNTRLQQLFSSASAGRTPSALTASNMYADPGQKIGIEFEVENWGGSHEFQEHWVTHSDASLRNGVEFVFSRGKMGMEIENALNLFCSTASTAGFTTGERTSTHIHMDMGDGQTVGDVRKMFILTYVIEPAMFRFADENRKWCSYCQPLTDMQHHRISSILTAQDRDTLVAGFTGSRHADKYYAFNLASLTRHTTIEFRYFPGYSDRATVDKWINMAQEVKLAARSVETVEELLAVLVDRSRLESFLRAAMPRSVAAGLLNGLDQSDAVKRAAYLNALMATSDIPTAGLHARIQQVQPGSAAARMLTALFNMRFDAASQRTALLRSILRNSNLTDNDLRALTEVISQIDNGSEFEQIISDFYSNN